VCRKRTVVIRYTIEVTTDVPESWTPEDIEFHRNESSWCANNIVAELEAAYCLCNRTTAQYLREATPEDEEGWNLDLDL